VNEKRKNVGFGRQEVRNELLKKISLAVAEEKKPKNLVL